MQLAACQRAGLTRVVCVSRNQSKACRVALATQQRQSFDRKAKTPYSLAALMFTVTACAGTTHSNLAQRHTFVGAQERLGGEAPGGFPSRGVTSDGFRKVE